MKASLREGNILSNCGTPLGLAVDGEGVVVVSGVADLAEPPVPARGHVLHPAPRALAVRVQILAGIHRVVHYMADSEIQQ